MSNDPTEKPASVAAFEGAEPVDFWAIPLDGVIPLSTAFPRLDPPQIPAPSPSEDVLSLDWTFQQIPSEGYHPQLNLRRKAA
jgi:hypothetical protein